MMLRAVSRSDEVAGYHSVSKMSAVCLGARQVKRDFDISGLGKHSGLISYLPVAFALSDSQDQGAAGSTARAAKIARGPAWSFDRHACCSRTGDQGGPDRDLQLLGRADLVA